MSSRLTPTAIVVTAAAVLAGGIVQAQNASTPEQRVAAAVAAGTLDAVVSALLSEGLTPEAVALALTAANVPTDTAAAALQKAGVSASQVVSALVAAAPADQKDAVQASASLATTPTTTCSA
ncbi:hypothetical protein ABXN37_10785 [Piscinibacter sakaiensis]|uniref:hypothetical protein n=1 Tax=Piscinibacter sakaiensis TaxID=1547922 RepID=UPI003729815D